VTKGKAITIGISTCLLGENVRYDGTHKLDHFLRDTLGQFVRWFPVCPEVEYGLPVPREAMRLVGDPIDPRLVTIRTGIDLTGGMKRWAKKKIAELAGADLSGFVFKSRSPSSGMKGVKVYTEEGMPSKTGSGIFAKAFMDAFPHIPVEDDGRLNDPGIRENFIERVFVYHRWKEFINNGGKIKNLVDFHADHKLMIMAHSPKHVPLLGSLIANQKKYRPKELLDRYFTGLTDAMKLQSTVRKNVNVLQHAMGYFKKQLSPEEKKELLEVIGNYHKGLIPLIVPTTLINHYVRKYDEQYLKRQHYLNPHPAELMLRNHV